MDIRSFNLDFEISMMCTDSHSFVAAMREVEDMYRSLSRELALVGAGARRGRCGSATSTMSCGSTSALQ